MHQLGKLTAGNLYSDQHFYMPYWILLTCQVNAFVAVELSRWLYCLKVIITTTNATMNGSVATPQDEQLVNGVMVLALVHMLCISSGAGSMFYSALQYKGKKRRQKRIKEDNYNNILESSEYLDGSEHLNGSEYLDGSEHSDNSKGKLFTTSGQSRSL